MDKVASKVHHQHFHYHHHQHHHHQQQRQQHYHNILQQQHPHNSLVSSSSTTCNNQVASSYSTSCNLATQSKRKEKARIAARARRSQEASIIMEMANELHITQEKIRRIDKATIVKLAIDYIKAYEILCRFCSSCRHNSDTLNRNNIIPISRSYHHNQQQQQQQLQHFKSSSSFQRINFTPIITDSTNSTTNVTRTSSRDSSSNDSGIIRNYRDLDLISHSSSSSSSSSNSQNSRYNIHKPASLYITPNLNNNNSADIQNAFSIPIISSATTTTTTTVTTCSAKSCNIKLQPFSTVLGTTATATATALMNSGRYQVLDEMMKQRQQQQQQQDRQAIPVASVCEQKEVDIETSRNNNSRNVNLDTTLDDKIPPLDLAYPAPKLSTKSIFAPKTNDVDSHFLMININERDGKSSFVLKADEEILEEDDLTHLAPQAGDMSIPLDAEPLDEIVLDSEFFLGSGSFSPGLSQIVMSSNSYNVKKPTKEFLSVVDTCYVSSGLN